MIPLLVDLEQKWRGGQNQFFLLLKGLYQRGFAAELLTAKGSSLGHRAFRSSFSVHNTSRGLLRIPAALRISDLISGGQFDLVHVNESHALTAAWLAVAHRRSPLLISRRVGFPLGKGRFSRARFDAATRIIASSNWIAEQLLASGADQKKITVIYEGVEIPPAVNDQQRRADRARWGISEKDCLLGCAGVLLQDKGQECVLRALPKLRADFPNCKLLLAGDGPDRARLSRLAAELGVADAAIFAGFVEDMDPFYRALDVFVFPALFEGLGTSLLSAMAYGVPSVTYFGCALGEIVEEGKNGLQVEPRNVDALAAAIQHLLSDNTFSARIGAAGRRRIETNFSAERMVDETISVYREVCA